MYKVYEVADASPAPYKEPLKPIRTGSGDDPNLMNLINQIEANTRDKA